jgi:hypothetical protein
VQLDLDESMRQQSHNPGIMSKEAEEKLHALNVIVQPLAAICLELGDMALRQVFDGLTRVRETLSAVWRHRMPVGTTQPLPALDGVESRDSRGLRLIHACARSSAFLRVPSIRAPSEVRSRPSGQQHSSHHMADAEAHCGCSLAGPSTSVFQGAAAEGLRVACREPLDH